METLESYLTLDSTDLRVVRLMVLTNLEQLELSAFFQNQDLVVIEVGGNEVSVCQVLDEGLGIWLTEVHDHGFSLAQHNVDMLSLLIIKGTDREVDLASVPHSQFGGLNLTQNTTAFEAICKGNYRVSFSNKHVNEEFFILPSLFDILFLQVFITLLDVVEASIHHCVGQVVVGHDVRIDHGQLAHVYLFQHLVFVEDKDMEVSVSKEWHAEDLTIKVLGNICSLDVVSFQLHEQSCLERRASDDLDLVELITVFHNEYQEF